MRSSRMAWLVQRTFFVWSSAFRRLFKDLPQEERPRKRGTPNTPVRTSVGRAAPSCLAGGAMLQHSPVCVDEAAPRPLCQIRNHNGGYQYCYNQEPGHEDAEQPEQDRNRHDDDQGRQQEQAVRIALNGEIVEIGENSPAAFAGDLSGRGTPPNRASSSGEVPRTQQAQHRRA